MSVFERSAGRLAVVLEEEDVPEAPIVLKVEHAIAARPQNLFNGLLGQCGERAHVVGRLNHHFVRPDSIHAIKKTVALPVERPFDSEGGELVGDYAKRPSRRIPAASISTVSENLGWGLAFISRAERAEAASLDLHAFPDKIHGAPGAIRRYDDPAACNRVFAKFGQYSSSKAADLLSAQ
jgi:hypothetical protein